MSAARRLEIAKRVVARAKRQGRPLPLVAMLYIAAAEQKKRRKA